MDQILTNWIQVIKNQEREEDQRQKKELKLGKRDKIDKNHHKLKMFKNKQTQSAKDYPKLEVIKNSVLYTTQMKKSELEM